MMMIQERMTVNGLNISAKNQKSNISIRKVQRIKGTN